MTTFDFDVFLSHSAQDRPAVHALAERLWGDGLRVTWDERQLARARVLVWCASPAGLAGWPALEHATLLFRDPADAGRRFIPLLLEDCDLPAAIAQFAVLDWRAPTDSAYGALLAACREEEAGPPARKAPIRQGPMTLQGHTGSVSAVAVAPNGKTIASGSADHTLKVWDMASGRCRATFEGHTEEVNGVVVTPDGKTVVTASLDRTLKVWDLAGGRCRASLKSPTGNVFGVTVTPDGQLVVSGSYDHTLKVWDLASGRCRATLAGHAVPVFGVAITPDGQTAVSASGDKTLKVWELARTGCLATLEGHTGYVLGVAVTPDGRTAVSASDDTTLKVWDLAGGRCRATLEGHTGGVWSVAVTPDGRTAVSASYDRTLKVWDLASGRCRATLARHIGSVYGVAVTPDGRMAVSASGDGTLRVWTLPQPEAPAVFADAARYTNAKVVLVGESGVGKTGLALRLAEGRWQETASTHGMNVWQLPSPLPNPPPLAGEGRGGGSLAVGFRRAAGLPPRPPALYGRDGAGADGD